MQRYQAYDHTILQAKQHSEHSAEGNTLGEYLIRKKIITPLQLDIALAEQSVTRERLGMILTRGGFVSRDQLIEAILETNPRQIHNESQFTYRVPSEVLIRNKAMITAERETEVYVATLESSSQTYVDLKGYYPEKEIIFTAANHEKIEEYLSQLQRMETNEDSLVDKLLRKAFIEGISDIHIIPSYGSYLVMARDQGVRRKFHVGTLDEYNMLVARIKDLSRMDMAERRIPQDGGFSMEFNSKIVQLRVATTPVNNMEYVVLRLLDADRVNPSLDKLGITNVDQWRKGVSLPDGICLICGPTGSGKSTTLVATMREYDRFSEAIFTLEDPVEYAMQYVGQVNVNPAVGLDFARGVRAFMRQDPDKIIVGEIRDIETARNAVKAAETGHLVLGTLHTRTIDGAISRLRDLDVGANELKYILRSVLVQRLVRTLCATCGGAAGGCPACKHTRYRGRTIVSECKYFRNDVEVQEMLDGKHDWTRMVEDAVNKVKQGITDAAEIHRVFGEAGDEELARQGIALNLDEVVYGVSAEDDDVLPEPTREVKLSDLTDKDDYLNTDVHVPTYITANKD
jgi:general secretion pathway protein E